MALAKQLEEVLRQVLVVLLQVVQVLGLFPEQANWDERRMVTLLCLLQESQVGVRLSKMVSRM